MGFRVFPGQIDFEKWIVVFWTRITSNDFIL